MKIYEAVLAFREAVVAEEGEVIRIILNKKGGESLQEGLDIPGVYPKMLFGIEIDVQKDCPTCGQSMTEEKT